MISIKTMTHFNVSAYDINRPTGQCAVTGRNLDPGEPYIATLVEIPATERDDRGLGFKRVDVAIEVWDEQKRPENLFAFWKSVVAEPNVKKRVFVDNEVLFNLFVRLGENEEPQRQAFRFVLTLILMRKKLLRYDGPQKRQSESSQGDGIEQEWWLVSPKLDLTKGPLGRWDPNRQMQVLNPHLGDDDIQQLSDQLCEILAAEI